MIMLKESIVHLDVCDDEESRLTVFEVMNTFGKTLKVTPLFSAGKNIILTVVFIMKFF